MNQFHKLWLCLTLWWDQPHQDQQDEKQEYCLQLAVEADNELGDKTDKDHERISLNSVMQILSIQTEPSQRHRDSDLMQQLQEKERRIQYLELKIQQLTQDSATILVEHQY